MAVAATAVWRVRPSGSNTNGGGYDPGISGAATDYSQQNSAQATGTLGTSTASTTFTDAGGAFTAAMVGNALWIASGSGFTVGAYFITGYTNSTTITLDRASGTGTAAHWAVGGGWADHTNLASTGPLVQGNIAYVLGSGTPNPSSYTYDYDFTSLVTIGASITITNDPATPGYKAPPDTTGGMPVIKFDVASSLLSTGTASNLKVSGLWFVGTTTAASNYALKCTGVSSNFGALTTLGCVLDQFSFDLGLLTLISSTNTSGSLIGCETFSSVAPGSAGSAYVGIINESLLIVIGCNLHDCVGGGIFAEGGNQAGSCISNSIIANCGAIGINSTSFGAMLVQNNTIDGNGSDGIRLSDAIGNNPVFNSTILNNIISNHTVAGKYGINVTASGAPSAFLDYNVFYNNTSNYNNLTAGPHDTALGVTPYVASSTENYTLV